MRRHNDTSPISSICLLIGTLAACVAPQVQAGALYKWIDENGQVRYSDRLPPSQVKKKHQELNPQGVVLSTTDDAQTDEERAAEAEARRKLEEEQAEAARLKAEQDHKDQVLLLTFSSEAELDHARNSRIEVLDSVIRLINKSIASTQRKLDRLETVAEANYRSQGKEIPGGMAQNIEHFSRKIANRNLQLKQKESEKQKINQQYEIDLARFRVLKAQSQNN